MKKILYSVLALAMAAFTFTSCEDVPMPYDDPNNNDGGGKDEPTISVPTGDGTLANPFNAAAANDYVEAGQNLDQQIYIKGIVSRTVEISPSYGNATFYISDDGTTGGEEFYIYRCYSLNNQKITSEDEVKVGDEVIIYGLVTNYNGTYETVQNQAYIYSLNGDTGSGDTPVEPEEGDGTETNPYTVADVIAKYNADNSIDEKDQWVTGYIIGYMPQSSTKLENTVTSATGAVASNIVLAPSATETDYTGKCLAVQLVSGSSARSALNLVDNPNMIGAQVKLKGEITKYCGAQGLKSVSEYVILSEGTGDDPSASSAYVKTTNVVDGTSYIIAANTSGSSYVIATPLNDTYNYGYLYTSDATENNGTIDADDDDTFILKKVTGGYTIQDGLGRYYYMEGTYNSFNVSTSVPSSGYIWDITFNSDQTVNIKNVDMGKTLQYSSQYTSFGAYADISNILPYLFVKE